jgi:hypothetical protein
MIVPVDNSDPLLTTSLLIALTLLWATAKDDAPASAAAAQHQHKRAATTPTP